MAAAKTTRQAASQGVHGALLAAIDDIGRITKAKKGGFGKYAPLDVVLEAIQPALHKQKLLITQPVTFTEEKTNLETGAVSAAQTIQWTILTHVPTGETIDSMVAFPEFKSAQQFGSSQTYFRRYLLMSLLGIASSDEPDPDQAAPEAMAKTPKTAQPTPADRLRDESESLAKSAFGNHPEIEALSQAIRTAAKKITGIKSPNAKNEKEFSAAMRRVSLRTDEGGEPVVELGPDPLLAAVSK